MQLPPNYGRSLRRTLRGAVRRASRAAEGAALVPFMLKGVADVPQAEAMFQPDRIHPLASAHPTILAQRLAGARPASQITRRRGRTR